MPDQGPDRREFAATMLDLFVQVPQHHRLGLMRAGTVEAVGDELAALVVAQIAETRSSIVTLAGSETLSGLIGNALAASNQERLASLEGVQADLEQVRRELAARPAPATGAAAPTASGHCPRCGNASSGGLCDGCRSHDRFVEDDRQAYERDLADLDDQRIRDDYVRDQQSYNDFQDTWRDD